MTRLIFFSALKHCSGESYRMPLSISQLQQTEIKSRSVIIFKSENLK